MRNAGLFGFGLIVIIVIEFCLVRSGYGYWIELFNGATWPPQFSAGKSFWFFLILALRTLINLGVVLTGVFGVYVLLVGPRRWLMRKLDSVLRIQNTALTGYLLGILRTNDVVVPSNVEDSLYEALDKFQDTEAGRHFLNEAFKQQERA